MADFIAHEETNVTELLDRAANLSPDLLISLVAAYGITPGKKTPERPNMTPLNPRQLAAILNQPAGR